jgi:hypothetical protein
MTGSPFAFKLYDFSWQFRERPIPILARVEQIWAGAPGVKTLSGFVLKGCTIDQDVVVTAMLDNDADPQTFTVHSSLEESETFTLQFSATASAGNILKARRAVDIGIAFDQEFELESWSPIVSFVQPVGVKVWDSGPIFDGTRERVWLRELLFKVRAKADLVCTPFFDGVAFKSVTIDVSGTDVDADCVFHVPVGRNYIGRQPRLVVESCEEFFPYWVQEVRRDSGAPSQKMRPRAPMTLRTSGGR